MGGDETEETAITCHGEKLHMLPLVDITGSGIEKDLGGKMARSVGG